MKRVCALLLVACRDPKDSGPWPDSPRGETADSADSADSAYSADSADGSPAATACDALPPMESFVTREGDQLLLDGEPFRFISVNVPDLLGIVDPEWRLPTPWEQRDGLCAVRQMGGRVARTYTLSVGDSGTEVPRMVLAPGELDPDHLLVLDNAVAAASEQGVRLIIPLVDQWSWVGGITEYAAFRDKEAEEFWTDEELIADFEATVEAVLGRTNTVTGVPYAEDPTILAWETGNELDAPSAWTARVAARIRELAPRQLMLDGHFGIDPESLENEDVDIVSDHYYWPEGWADDYAGAAAEDRAASAGARPFVVGEFGLVSTDRVEELIDEVVENGSAGALIWSLRFHAEEGGFYFHTEYDDGSTVYAAYHWPGFASGDAWDERRVLSLVSEAGWAVQGGAWTPAPPEAPVVLDVDFAGELRWRGSAGAASYILERAPSAEGPWEEAASGFDDATIAVRSAVSVLGGEEEEGWFRLRAVGAGGSSEASEAWGPVPLGELFEDPLDDLSLVTEHDETLRVDGTNQTLFDGDTGRVCRGVSGEASLAWVLDQEIVSFSVDAWAWPWEDTPVLGVETSEDGERWTAFTPEVEDLGGDWVHQIYGGQPPAGTRGLRITLPEHGGEVWNPQIGRVRMVIR